MAQQYTIASGGSINIPSMRGRALYVWGETAAIGTAVIKGVDGIFRDARSVSGSSVLDFGVVSIDAAAEISSTSGVLFYAFTSGPYDGLIVMTHGGGSVSAGSAAPSAPTAPANTSAPTISGTAQVGQPLIGMSGVWTGSPSPTLAYQWQRGTADIAGATSLAYTPVAGDAGSTLRLKETASNGVGAPVVAYSANTAVVADAAPAGKLPVGARIAFFGDSIIQQGGMSVVSSGNPMNNIRNRVMSEAEVAHMLGPRFYFDIWPDPNNVPYVDPLWGPSASAHPGGNTTNHYYNGALQGYSGASSAQLKAQIPNIRTMIGWDAAVVAIGTNSANSATDVADNIAPLVADLKTGGKPVALCTIRPSGVSRLGNTSDGAAYHTYIPARNTEIRALWDEQNKVYGCDLFTAYDTAGDGYLPTEASTDGVHQNGLYTPRGALAMSNTIANMVEEGNIFLRDYWGQYANALTDARGRFEGTAGEIGVNVTGVTPTGWRASGVTTPANISVVSSLEANPVTGGQTWVLTITPDAANKGRVLLDARPAFVAAAVAGKRVKLWAEVELDGSPCWVAPVMKLTRGPADVNQFSTMGDDLAHTLPCPVWSGRTIWPSVPTWTPDASTTSVGCSIELHVNGNGSSAPMVAKIKRIMAAIDGPDPKVIFAPLA